MAAWRHAVMGAERLIAERQILLGIGIEIAEGGRQAVAAMLLGNAAERPQRILQALGQCDEALAAEDYMGMLEPVCQRDAGNRYAERARVGEVGQAKTAGLMLLSEDNVLLWARQRPPTPHAPFQRASDAGADLGVAPPDLFENRNGADAGGSLQDRDDLALPNIGKRVGPSPATRRLLPGWQARIILDPVAGRYVLKPMPEVSEVRDSERALPVDRDTSLPQEVRTGGKHGSTRIFIAGAPPARGRAGIRRVAAFPRRGRGQGDVRAAPQRPQRRRRGERCRPHPQAHRGARPRHVA
jgi:hypothetical protein